MNITTWVIRIIALFIALIGHEVAHGYVAYRLGDPTAKSEGRLSLNPLKHIDPIGLVAMVVLKFGWAKAVPINPGYFKNVKRDTILVSLAGVTFNFLAAIIFGFFYARTLIYHQEGFFSDLLATILWYNVMLGVFNLVPLPPLDGSKVIISLLPLKFQYYIYKYERYLYFLLVIAVFSGFVDKVVGPIILWVLNMILRFWVVILL